jgi:hypothetical protein
VGIQPIAMNDRVIQSFPECQLDRAFFARNAMGLYD